MEAQAMISEAQAQLTEQMAKESAFCPGGTIYKTKMTCGCCFCEKGSCFCEWHEGVGGCWS